VRIRANRKNLKQYAKELLGKEYTPEAEKKLIDLCTKKTVVDYVDGCEHPSFAVVRWMVEIDELLHTYGVESLYPDVDLDYCNAGDTYALTILYYKDKLWIGDWGCVAEEFIDGGE